MAKHVVEVGTELNDAEKYIASLMCQGYEIIDMRRDAWSYESHAWAREPNLRTAYGKRYHKACEFFWNPHMYPDKFKIGLRTVLHYLETKDLIFLGVHGVHSIIHKAIRAEMPDVDIKSYNGVIAVEASQQALF